MVEAERHPLMQAAGAAAAGRPDPILGGSVPAFGGHALFGRGLINRRSEVRVLGKAESICSHRAFPVLPPKRTS